MIYKKIFSKRVSVQLISLGNNLLSVEPNKKLSGLSVFIFEDTEKLSGDLTNITANLNK